MAVTNILIVGVGGQGTLLTSRILAQAAINMGHDVKVSEIHGMAQRGGSVVTQVRYGDQVYAPIIQKGTADILLAFEKLEAARLLDYLRPSRPREPRSQDAPRPTPQTPTWKTLARAPIRPRI